MVSIGTIYMARRRSAVHARACLLVDMPARGIRGPARHSQQASPPANKHAQARLLVNVPVCRIRRAARHSHRYKPLGEGRAHINPK